MGKFPVGRGCMAPSHLVGMFLRGMVSSMVDRFSLESNKAGLDYYLCILVDRYHLDMVLVGAQCLVDRFHLDKVFDLVDKSGMA